jgi:hypothetical protein
VTLRDGLQTRTCRTAPARVPLGTTRPAYGQGDARSAATSADGLLRGTAGRRIGFGPTARLGTIWGPHVLHAGRRPARRLGVHTVLIPPLTRIDAYSNVLGSSAPREVFVRRLSPRWSRRQRPAAPPRTPSWPLPWSRTPRQSPRPGRYWPSAEIGTSLSIFVHLKLARHGVLLSVID